MDTTIYSDERIYQVRQLVELTQNKKVNWECIEYNPLSFMLGGDWGKPELYLAQMFTLRTERSGMVYELQISEDIDLHSGKGDIAITLEREETADYMKYDDALSFDAEKYRDCPAEELENVFKNHVAVLFASAVPEVLKSDAVKETFPWASYVNEDIRDIRLLEHPLFRLGERLLNEHDLLSFHRCVLDIGYRQKLLDDLK